MSRGIGVTEGLRETLPDWTEQLFLLVSLLGDWLVIVPVLGLLYLGAVLASLRIPDGPDPDEPLCADRTVTVIATVFGGLALAIFLKAAFDIPRPPAELHAVPESDESLPSGHTMSATVFWGALALWGQLSTRRRRFASASVAVVLVAVSRLALGVHFLVDVVVAVGLGCLYLAAIARFASDRPGAIFVVAIGFAVLGIITTGGGTQAILALVGSVMAPIGWRLVERESVRRQLVRLTAPLR